jgi:hypothetical protein
MAKDKESILQFPNFSKVLKILNGKEIAEIHVGALMLLLMICK